MIGKEKITKLHGADASHTGCHPSARSIYLGTNHPHAPLTVHKEHGMDPTFSMSEPVAAPVLSTAPRKRVYRCKQRKVRLTTTRNEKLAVTVSIPNDDDECPITMGPMKEDALDFLPDQTLFPHLPDLRKTTLPCGHSFGSMNLLYYFSRNSTMCPNCRAGFSSPLSLDCIPAHVAVVRGVLCVFLLGV